MTMTEDIRMTTITEDITTETTVRVGAKELVSFAKNAVLFCSTDTSRPVLTHTLTSVDGGRLRTVSTDSYGLLDQSITVDGDETSPSVLVDWRPVAALKLTGGAVKVTISSVAIVVDADTQVVSLPAFDADFPRTADLYPKALNDRAGTDVFSFGVGQLRCFNKLAKLTAPGARFNKARGEQVTYIVTPGASALKPFTVESTYEGWDAYALFMPVRLS